MHRSCPSRYPGRYLFCASVLSPQEWKDELKSLVALAELDDDENDPVRKEAISKITAIYGEGAETKSYEELCRMSCRIGNARGIINLRKENVSSLGISWPV